MKNAEIIWRTLTDAALDGQRDWNSIGDIADTASVQSSRRRSFSKPSQRTATCVLTPWFPQPCPPPKNFSMTMKSTTRSVAALPQCPT